MDNHRDQGPKEVRGERVAGSGLLNPNSSFPVPPHPELPDSSLSFTIWFLETHLGYFNSDLREVLVKKKTALQGNPQLSLS